MGWSAHSSLVLPVSHCSQTSSGMTLTSIPYLVVIVELPVTEPLNPFTEDHSCYKDGELWTDSDGDGLLGITEIDLGTDPRTFDTDRDGLSDGEEFNPFDVVAGAFSWEDARDDARVRL